MAFSIAKKYNTERIFDIDTTGLKYHNIEAIFIDEEEVYVVEAVYMSDKGRFGIHPCVVLRHGDWRGYVNLPKFLTGICRDILDDDDAVNAIKNGKVGMTFYTYIAEDYDNKLCYSVKWVDL